MVMSEQKPNFNVNDDSKALLDNVIDWLGITRNRFPSQEILYDEVEHLFITSNNKKKITSLTLYSPQFIKKHICERSLIVFAHVFEANKLYVNSQPDDPWPTAACMFMHHMDRYLSQVKVNNVMENEAVDDLYSDEDDEVLDESEQHGGDTTPLVLDHHYILSHFNHFDRTDNENNDEFPCVHLQNLWKLLAEEVWWRLFIFNDWNAFSHVPSQEEMKKKVESNNQAKVQFKPDATEKTKRRMKHNDDPYLFINYYDLELRSREAPFKMSKQAHEFIRYLIWGYHYGMTSDLWDEPLSNLETVKHVVLIDMDNVGKAITELATKNFSYPDTVFFIVAGPSFNPTRSISKLLDTIPERLRYIQILFDKSELSDARSMNGFEQYLFKFYESGYFTPYRDAADYCLCGIAGILHRRLPLHVNLWVLSRDDGLKHPVRHIHMRGRPSFIINQKDLLSVFDEYLLDHDELERKLHERIDTMVSDWSSLDVVERESLEVNIDNSIELSEYSQQEIDKVFLSSGGIDFDRRRYEEEMGSCVADYIQKHRNKFAILQQLRVKGRRIGYKGWMKICKEIPFFIDKNMLFEIDLRGGRIGDEGIEELCRVLQGNRSVYFLDLGACFCADRGAIALASFVKQSDSLQILDLRWNKIGRVGATALAEALVENNSLVILNMRVNQPTLSGASAILRTILQKKDCCVSGVDLRECKADFGSTFSEILKERKEEGSSDQVNRALSVDLCGNGLNSNSAASISGILSSFNYLNSWYITRFMLDYNNIGSLGLQYLSKALCTNETLVVLTLARNGIDSAGAVALAEALRHNTTLTHIDIHKNPIGNIGVYALADVLAGQNQTLAYLNLKFTDCTDFGAVALSRAIRKNDSLTFLDLSKNNIGTVGGVSLGRALENNMTLNRLILDENNVGDSAFRVLSRNFGNQSSYHVRVELERCNIRGQGLKQMSLEPDMLEYISHLNLGSNFLGSDNIAPVYFELKDWLPTLHINASPMMPLLSSIFSSTSLRFVELQNNNIGDRGVELLLASGSLPNVMFLNLGTNNISEKGALCLSNVLKDCDTNQLIGLNLNHNNLGDEGAGFIADVLKSSITLTNLKLQNNSITCIGAAHLSRALCSSPSRSVLDYLDLEKNLIADEGAIHIAESVAQNHSLSFVSLERNSLITQAGASLFYQNGAKILSDPESEVIAMLQITV